MKRGLILGEARLGRAATAPARLLWVHSGCRVNAVPAVTPAAALTKFRLEELAAHFRDSLTLHSRRSMQDRHEFVLCHGILYYP
jgi:hypothetical protein